MIHLFEQHNLPKGKQYIYICRQCGLKCTNPGNYKDKNCIPNAKAYKRSLHNRGAYLKPFKQS